MSHVPFTATQQTTGGADRGDIPRILVVDDEEYICDICTRTLRNAAYEVVSTTDALFALQQLKVGAAFDLLLVDIRMPLISGLELAQHAREIDPAIAIIIMTGHTSTENLRQAVQRGVADFLSKPFELSELRLAVEQALNKRRLLQDNLRLRAVEQLLQSSEAINATLDLPQLSRIILEMALRLTSCQFGFILLYDEQRDRLRVEPSATDSWHLFEAGHAVALETYTRGHAQRVQSPEALCSDGGGQGVSHGLSVPLRAQGEVVGILLLCDDRPEVLRPGTQEMLALLANQAGTALRNAHLYGQLQDTYQRLQELDRLKSEFIAIASHELRTPLSIVLGYAMMVRDQSEDQDNRREYAQRVLESAQRIKDIVDDMVSLRHLELGEVPLTIDECDVQEIVSQVIDRMEPGARHKGHTLTVDLPDAPLDFLADREKLLLVLGNLVSNAIKFTPYPGHIKVNVSHWADEQVRAVTTNTVVTVATPNHTLDVPATVDAGWVVFQISDTGIGIPEREQPRIFERFYQVADSLTRQQGGTGLGLAIVRELTALQDGVVWVESVEEQGSTFSFALPYRTK
jgi:signal transduction histidine kinase